MLNATTIIRRLEKKLGFKFMDLEISHDEIIENLKDETLKVFSKYFPYQEVVVINPDDKVPGYENRFFIRTKTECINLNRLVGSSLMNCTFLDNILHPANFDIALGSPITRQLNLDILSYSSNPVTATYHEPSMIEITPIARNIRSYVIVMNVMHPSDFSTIGINMEDQFMKYALADTQSVLYEIRSRFSNINTPYGNMELFLDKFQGAEDQKRELEEQWRKYSGKNAKRKKIFIA